jgi:hypothetical protein
VQFLLEFFFEAAQVQVELTLDYSIDIFLLVGSGIAAGKSSMLCCEEM